MKKGSIEWKLEQIRKKLNEIITVLNEEVLKYKKDREYEYVMLEMNEEFDW